MSVEPASTEVAGAFVAERRLVVVLTSLSSDAHTWNLVYLQLLLEEMGCEVMNLGACTSDETIVKACLARRPDLVVISSVNGHGGQDGVRLIGSLKAHPSLVATPVVIGGKLDVVGGVSDARAQLLAAGFDAVFNHVRGVDPFASYVRSLPVGGTGQIDTI
jgi:methylaspartate mutase sigma subunit